MSDLTVTQLRQLLTYCGQCELDGWYYGNKVQFENRHKAIVEWITTKLNAKETPVHKIDAADWPEPDSGFAKLGGK